MKTLIDSEKLDSISDNLSNYINQFEDPIVVCVLNGGFMFFADLINKTKQCDIDFIRPKSYSNKTRNDVKLLKDFELDLNNRDVMIIDDIIDSGNTIIFIDNHIKKTYKPKSITYLCVIDKTTNLPYHIISGVKVNSDSWLVGYGMDGENCKRNTKIIYEV